MALLAFTGGELEPNGSTRHSGRWEPMVGSTEFVASGVRSARAWISDGDNWSRFRIGSAPSTLIFGVAVCPVSTLDAGDPRIYMYSDAGTVALIRINIANGTVSFYRGTNETSGTLIATSDYQPNIDRNIFSWLSAKIVWHASAGSVEITMNGVTVIDVSGVNTLGSASPPSLISTRCDSTFGTAPMYDDLIVCDDTGSAPFNDLLDDMTVASLLPNSDVTKEWTRSTGTDNYALVDEPQLVLTDYVSATAANTIDVYGMSTTTANNIQAVQAVVSAKVYTGPHTVRAVINTGSNSTSSNVEFESATVLSKTVVMPLAPNGGAWSNTLLNSAQLSIELM